METTVRETPRELRPIWKSLDEKLSAENKVHGETFWGEVLTGNFSLKRVISHVLALVLPA